MSKFKLRHTILSAGQTVRPCNFETTWFFNFFFFLSSPLAERIIMKGVRFKTRERKAREMCVWLGESRARICIPSPPAPPG